MSRYVIEEESGTYTRSTARDVHVHNGYSAGQVAASSPRVREAWFAWGRAESARMSAGFAR